MINKKNIGLTLGMGMMVAAAILTLHTARADAANLISNPSVETGSSSNPLMPQSWFKGGYGSNTRTLTYPVPGYDGARAVRVDISGYTDGDAKWYFNYVPVNPGDNYFFSDNFLSNTTSYLTVQFKKTDGTFRYLSLGSLPADGSWQFIQKNFVVPSNVTGLTIFHALRGDGYLVSDNYVLKKIISPAADPNNLISNPSMELPSSADPNIPKNWLQGGYGSNTRIFTYPVAGNDGWSGAKVEITSHDDGDAKWYFNPVAASSGDSFEYSDYSIGSIPNDVTARFTLKNGAFQYQYLGTVPAATSWTKFDTTLTAPANTAALTVFHNIDDVGTLKTDSYYLKKLPSNKFAQGMVTLTFDDGYQSVYDNAIPILRKAGIKSSHYIVSTYTDYTGFMNLQEIAELNKSGYEIGSHTRTHPYLTQLSDTDAWNEISGGKSDITGFGFTPNSVFVYPFGDYDDRIKQMVKKAGFIAARSTIDGFNFKNTDKFELQDERVLRTTTVSQVQSWIDQALADHSWLIIELHQTLDSSNDLYSNNVAMIQAIADYITKTGIKVISVPEGVAMMNP